MVTATSASSGESGISAPGTDVPSSTRTMLASTVLGEATSTVTGVPHICTARNDSEMELITVMS
jgi:hypothetical protein